MKAAKIQLTVEAHSIIQSLKVDTACVPICVPMRSMLHSTMKTPPLAIMTVPLLPGQDGACKFALSAVGEGSTGKPPGTDPELCGFDQDCCCGV